MLKRSATLAEHQLCGNRSWKGNGQNNKLVSSVTQVQRPKIKNLRGFFCVEKSCMWMGPRGFCSISLLPVPLQKATTDSKLVLQLQSSLRLEGWGILFTSLAYFKAINIRDCHLHCATGTCQVNDCTCAEDTQLCAVTGVPWVLPSSFQVLWTMNVWCRELSKFLWTAKWDC